MTKRIMLLGTAAVAWLAMAAAREADACFQCTSSQWCTQGALGGQCEVYSEGGRQWCQHTLDCKPSITMTPLDVSPSGTFLAQGGAQIAENGVQKQQCNGFIVGHLPTEADAGDDLTISI